MPVYYAHDVGNPAYTTIEMHSMSNTYWDHNGTFQHTADSLRTRIPSTGSVTRPRSDNAKLERYRRACNCYYDLYNNGLCNRSAEFRKVFDIRPSYYRTRPGKFGSDLYERVEIVMDQIIMDAAKEQQIELIMDRCIMPME